MAEFRRGNCNMTVKISDLPQAVLPLTGNEQLELTQTIAGKDDSRRVSATDLAGSALGLDATFITVTPNAVLPNERILTAGTNINIVDGGAGNPITVSISFPLLAPDGSALAPSYSFASDPNTGFFLSGPDVLVVAIAGVNRWEYNGNQFRSDQFSGGPALVAANTSANTPTVLPHQGRTGSGLASGSGNQVELVADGETGVSYRALSGEVTVTNKFEDGIVASTTQTQFQGQLNSSYSEVITVANPNDVVTAPQKNRGMQLVIVNRGANVLQVFPSTNNDFGNGPNNSITVAAGDSLIAVGGAGSTGQFWDVLYNGPSSGFGNVFKVGIPVDEQIGVWTGDGTLEGDAQFQWDRTNKRLEIFGSGLSSRMRMEHDNTDFNMTAVNGGAFIINGLGDGIDIESNASSPAGNLYFKVHGDSDFPSDFVTARFVNDNVGDLGGTNVQIFGQRETTPGGGDVQIFHTGANHVAAVIVNGPAGQSGGIGTQNAATPFSLFTDSTERVRIEGSGEVGIRHGNVLAIYDTTDAFSLKWSHDGVDGLLATVGTTDINITGLSGRIKQGAETLAFVSEIGSTDPLLLSSGGVGVPTYSFAVDTDTGVYNPGLDILGLTAGGVLGLSVTEVAGAITVDILDNLTIDATTGPGPHLSIINVAPSADVIDVLPTGSTLYNFATLRDQTGANFFFIRHDYSLSSLNHRLDFSSNAHNDILRLSSSTQQVAMIQQNYFFDETSFHISATKFLEFDERNTSPVPGAADGAFWVRDDVPNVPMFTDDAGTDFVLNAGVGPGGELPAGTVTDASLRWNGSAWVENTLVRMTAVGALLTNALDSLGASTINVGGMDEADPGFNLEDGMSLRFEDRAQTNDFWIQNQGVGAIGPILYLDGPSTGIFTIGDGLGFRIEDAGNTDWVQMAHNGTYFTMGGVNTDALQIEYPILMDEQAAAGADVAGYGQWWVRDDTPNTPMFTDDAGNDFALNLGTTGRNHSVQARRTTDYLLTTAFVDITMDVTDVETDATVLDHDLVTNTDNIIIGATGTYEVMVDVTADPDPGAANRRRSINARVRLNDAGTGIPGSVNHTDFHRDATAPFDNHLSFTFIVSLTATDFITLQLSETLTGGGAGTDNANEISMKAVRLI